MVDVSLTYLVLAHNSTERVARLVDQLLAQDLSGRVIIHFDKKSGEAPYQWLCERYHSQARCYVLPQRAYCGWGQWSLVDATLRMLRHAQSTGKTDYYYLMSEYCYPTQSLSALKSYLVANKGTNFIECEDSRWIKGGIREDRYLYRHFLNKRNYPRLHRWTYKVQKWLGLKRKVPQDLTIRFGSQWWCLTQEAVAYVLEQEPIYRSFFKWVWIPDECFFNSLCRQSHLKIAHELTYYSFNLQGTPDIMSHREVCHLGKQYYFARKVT
ncbi:beta-1,6-N-acetylglucosaminyltransferase [Halomonas sp. KO116]|uniref:beta-1,6-N-acetylglucosaminyltransferase n=1 Tax=Halomonas sp. KO116 TaxID=1504981 RepID=UPI0004E29D19|nr:beta-1,6-N-acetylglucosaminyltransferase [Halomonas sp. KO116]AJY51400.1 glycosyl transferase family 14 [Halomonas sp. KO116]